MPPKKRIEATVYIVDCSAKVEERLKLLHKIHALKYFAQTKGATRDLQKIILFNHPGLKAKHVVNDWQYYSFEILKSIKTQIEEADQDFRPHNFLYVLHGAIEALKSDDILPEQIKRIVFITDLSSNMEYDVKTDTKIEFIKSEIVHLQAWLYVIGLNVKLPLLFKEHEIPKLDKIITAGEITPEQKTNLAVLSKITKNVVFVDEENGLDVIFAHKVQPKAPFPWYVKINIGPDLEIPVVVYRTTRDPEIIKFSPCPSVIGQPVSSTKIWYDVNSHEKVQQTDVVKGYKFQGKFTEITDEQLKNSKKIFTQKCLTVFGFANADETPVNLYMVDDTISCIKPDTRGPQSASDRRFALFVTSLRVKNSVALAYRVYNNRNNRKFYCLFPCPEHKNDGHLLMGQFPYQHEFHEGFVRGKVEETPYQSDTYNLMSEFLDSLSSFDKVNAKELYPLPPSMQISKSRARMAEFLAAKALKEDPGDAPKLTMHPVLEEKASEKIETLLKNVVLD